MSYMDITNAEFNDIFMEEIQKEKKQRKVNEELRLKKLDEKYKYKLTELNLYDLFIGIKETWINLIYDVIYNGLYLGTLTKENRLFFIGLTLLLIIIVIVIIKQIKK